MAYSTVELEFQFTDKTTKKWQIGPFETNALESLKAKIKAFNAKYDGNTGMGGNIPSWYNLVTNDSGAKLLMSNSGYPNVPILNAVIVNRQETNIPLYD